MQSKTNHMHLLLATPCSWEALLLVLDNRPFPDLRHILRYNDDSRARVFAEWVSAGGCRAFD